MTIYFAWVDPGTAFNAVSHSVHDETIISFQLSQDEGDLARLTLEIKNPKVGPLSAGRKVWAWFSSDGTPLFYGRLVAIPSDLLAETITYVLVARPADLEEQKTALADTLRVLPYYDEIFISEEFRDDADAVLEGYSKLFHYNRTSHVVTVSDVLSGEDGLIVFGSSDIPYDSLNMQIARAPLTAVTVKAGIPWAQSTSATISFNKVIPSFQSSTIIENWPKVGDGLAGGYYVVSSSAVGNPGYPILSATYNFSWTNQAQKHNDGDTMSIEESFTGPGSGVPPGAGFRLSGHFTEFVVGDPSTGTPASSKFESKHIVTFEGSITGSLVLGVNASRERKDNVTINVVSDVQQVLVDTGDTSTSEIIDLSTTDVSQSCGGDDPPIQNTGRSEYITTDRGIQSVEYMLQRARARLAMGARVVDVSFNCRLSAAIAAGISLRKNGFISDSRIPSGGALGKIVHYTMRGDGRSGKFIAEIQLSCCPGLGGSITPSPGSGDYVSNDYVDPSYQTYIAAVYAAASGDIGYSRPVLVGGGGGVFFAGLSYSDIVIRDEIISSVDEQDEAIASSLQPLNVNINELGAYNLIRPALQRNSDMLAQALGDVEMWWELELKDLTGPGIEAHYEVPTVPLVLPKQVDFT